MTMLAGTVDAVVGTGTRRDTREAEIADAAGKPVAVLRIGNDSAGFELVAQPPERVSMVMSAAPKPASLLGVVGGNTTDQREPRPLRRTRACCRWA
jgi:hypothetical protein